MRSSSTAARAAIVLGALAILALPAAAAAAQFTSLKLLRSLYVAAPAGFVLGILALVVSRRARLALQRSLHPERRRLVRVARVFAWVGAYVGTTGALALVVYAVLRWAQ